MESKRLNVVQIQLDNYMNFETLVLKPTGITKLSGKNGAGKTAVLKAIERALLGQEFSPDEIRIDAKKAVIELSLNNGLAIKRTLTGGGTTLNVTRGDETISKPQQFIDTLLGYRYSLNPIRFINEDPREQRKIFLNAMPLKISAEEFLDFFRCGDTSLLPKDFLSGISFDTHALEVVSTALDKAKNLRYTVNSRKTELKKTVERLTADLPQDYNPDSYKQANIADVVRQKESLEKFTRHYEDGQETLDRMAEEHRRNNNDIEIIQKEIEALEQKINRLKERNQEIIETGKPIKANLNEDKQKYSDIFEIELPALESRIARADEIAEVNQKVKSIKDYKKQFNGEAELHSAYDAIVKALTDEIPQKLISKIDLPIEGLAIKEDGLYLNGKAVKQLSDGEKLKFAVDMAVATCGNFGFVNIDRFETLDDENKQTLIEYLKKIQSEDLQFFITQVGKGELTQESLVSKTATSDIPASDKSSNRKAMTADTGDSKKSTAELFG